MTQSRAAVAVFGSSTVQPDEPVYRMAMALGRELAQADAIVITGGYSGTMEACSRGAHEAGGHVVGVTVELFEKRSPCNAWVKERVHTPDLYERLRYLVDRATAFVVLPGSIGTLTELFLTWTLLSVSARPEAPLILLGSHWNQFLDVLRHPNAVLPHLFEHVRVAETPIEAVEMALERAPRVPRS